MKGEHSSTFVNIIFLSFRSLFQDNGSAAFDALVSIASSGLTSQQRVALMNALNQSEANTVPGTEGHAEGVDGDAITSNTPSDQANTTNEESEEKNNHEAGEDNHTQ